MMYADLMDRLVHVDLKMAMIWILSDWVLIILCGKKKKGMLRGCVLYPALNTSPGHQQRQCQLWQTDTAWQVFMGFYLKLCI